MKCVIIKERNFLGIEHRALFKPMPFFSCFKINDKIDALRTFLLYGIEMYEIKNGKWKRCKRKKWKIWFKLLKSRYLDKQLKNYRSLEECPYYTEHELYDWNKKK